MTTCTAQIGLTPAVNTSVPIAGTVTWSDGAGAHSMPVNQPYLGGPTTVTFIDKTSVQMTASSSGFNSQILTVTCGQYTQFELTQSAPPPPATTVQITSVQAYPKHLESRGSWVVTDNAINVSWTATGQVDGLYVELDSSGNRVEGRNFSGTGASGTSGTINDIAVPTPGATYTVWIRGFQSGRQTAPSAAVTFTAAVNFRSLKDFLKYSGVSGNSGIRRFFPAHAQINLRAVTGV
jgi:hypothetical protein